MSEIDPREQLRAHLELFREMGIEYVDAPDIAADGRRTNAELLEQLYEDHVKGCTRCPLHKSRKNVVFGEGAPDADIMFIGEGPGRDEDEQGRPFVGRAGQKLNDIIHAMGLERGDVYIANILKSRPPGNRNPEPEEVEACIPYLRAQIDIIQPKVICALGSVAAHNLLNIKTPISRMRGEWYEYMGIPVMPTFHPAFLLRNYTPTTRRQMWEDMQQVLERVRSGG